jgi:hypothetical protein
MESDRGLKIGTIAPNFSTINISDDKIFSLYDEAKKYRGVLINFIRGNF